MTEQRDFLGDEVHMMQSDIKTLRHENDLLKMKSERQDETITTLNSDIARLRGAYEDKIVENATLQSILENVGLAVSGGLERYLKRRELKRDTVRIADGIAREETPRARFSTASHDPVTTRLFPTARPVVEKNPEPDADPPPGFLSKSLPVKDHPLLPRIQARSDEDIMRGLARGIDKEIAR
jgi:hypothetical protein